jgi:hypothetical protein
MIAAMVRILTGPVVDRVAEVWTAQINKAVTEQELRAQVATAVVEAISEVPESQAKVLIAEAQGDVWLQKSWRPLTGALLGFTVFFWAVLVPVAVDWLGLPTIRIGDQLLEWVFTALLGFGSVYAGGRTLEKIADRVTARLGR